MTAYPTRKDSFSLFNRYRFLTVLNAAITCEEYHFVKQASMLWLANYPGDLFVQYFLGLTYTQLGKHESGKEVLHTLTKKDPLFIEPVQALITLAESEDEKETFSNLYLYLTSQNPPENVENAWLSPLWDARVAFNHGDYDKAIELIHHAMVKGPRSAILAILHLKIAYKLENAEMLRNLSEIYQQRWPECLQINIIKALSDMDLGFETKAVERLHWVASQDSSGQVIQGLMGENHRFKELWPDQMEIFFDLPIPAQVSSYLGWNKLDPGPIHSPVFKQELDEKDLPEPQANDSNQDVIDNHVQSTQEKSIPASESSQNVMPAASTGWASAEDLEEVQSIFAKLAKRLKQPDLERTDNRFPVYVIMSSKKQLENTYGPNTAGIIDELLKNLAGLIQGLPDWDAVLFYPDDPAQMAQYGLKPIIATDAWEVKLALADLDNALAQNGEMVGALLIVGGPEILPYHHLPNPTRDNDLDVPSDNPYMTIDENYFIPQWPAGRLPGETGSDAGLLLHQIRQIIYQYEQRSKKSKSGRINLASMFTWLLQLFTQFNRNIDQKKQLGYSAEIWKAASARVYRTVGREKDLNLSPPENANTLILNPGGKTKLGYFNLHGIKDGPNWYGQKDFLNGSTGPDYPIALRPDMFDDDSPAPKLVLTEACYGANVHKKQYEEALSLKCLDSGTETFIGSTCIAYGSIAPPLVAADYLAEKFWQNVLQGRPAGYALMQAKLSLAEEMIRLQGFLDGEDQKTILSFVLFGDPLAVHDGIKIMPKPIFRLKDHPSVLTMSDSDFESTIDGTQLPKKVNYELKKTVEKYLPGLQNAQMQINKSQQPGNEKSLQDGRYVVTLEKSYDQNQHTTHHHFARMTFNEQGKLIKFTTSR